MREELYTLKLEVFDSLHELPEDERMLVEEAMAAIHAAYAPYSNFRVGAAVSGGGGVFRGSNQENAAYTGSHAERTALDAAGVGGKKRLIGKIAIVGEAEDPITPCGPCRQDIKEVQDLAGSPITILMAGSRGRVWRVLGIDGLLPLAFGPANLKL